MLRTAPILTVMLAVMLVGLAGCSAEHDTTRAAVSDAGDAASSRTDASEDASPGSDDTGSDDADTEADAQTDVSSDAARADRPLLPDFAYYKQDMSCGDSSCTAGVAVNTIGAVVGKTENGYTRFEDLEDHEVRFLEDFVLTEQTHSKMSEGWSCPSDTDVDGVQWWFDARLLVDGSYERAALNISGCIADPSTEGDPARVRDIIGMLDQIRDDHFE